MKLNIVENLLKLIIISMNNTKTINFKEYNLNLNNLLKNDFIKNEFSKYLSKIQNIFYNSFISILSEISKTFLRFLFLINQKK